jgi:predicted acetyltransferase
MTALTPAAARLVTPSESLVASYVEAQRACDGGTPLPREILEISARNAIRIVQKANDSASNTRTIIYRQLWMIVGETVVGRVSLRPTVGALDASIGHIAYEVFRAFRGGGFGHRALALGLEELRRSGRGDVSIVCEADNLASIRIIEAAGGALESVVSHPNFPDRPIRRYWVRA